uniref:PFK domain-containing protein n=1 Tax=Globodera pallida TaxID=36090 RepID=A0A183CTT1_GLOPA
MLEQECGERSNLGFPQARRVGGINTATPMRIETIIFDCFRQAAEKPQTCLWVYAKRRAMMAKQKVAMLTAGGLAPCLSSAVGGLIERYSDIAPEIDIIAYRSGYQGVLLGDRIEITKDMREKAHLLHRYGGSPIGNSRVKL